MGRAIFISYRRDDTEGEAGRLFDDLVRAFGDNSVFMDVAGINPGMDFRKAIDDNVSGCGVLLAMIGPTWTSIANHDGTRRLDDPNDFVRLEIASALGRSIAMIPVLVHDAKMPHPDELPDNLKDLAYRNSVEITHARWNSDVQLLIGALGQYVSASSRTSEEPVHATVAVQLPPANPPAQATVPAKKSKKGLFIGIGAAAVVLIILIAVIASHGSGSTDSDTSAKPETATAASPTTDASRPEPSTDVSQPNSSAPETQSVSTEAANPLAGMWINPAPMSDNGLDRLEISEAGGQVWMHAWGNVGDSESDWGKRAATEDGDQLSASWGPAPSNGRVAKITVEADGSKLDVTIDNTFRDHAPVSHQFEFQRPQ